MKNFVQPGNRVTVPAPAPVKGGDVVIIGQLAGIAFGDAVADEPVDLALSGVFDLPKVAADAITVGDAVYYDAAAKLVTGDDAGGSNPRIGHAVAVADAGSATVRVRIHQR